MDDSGDLVRWRVDETEEGERLDRHAAARLEAHEEQA